MKRVLLIILVFICLPIFPSEQLYNQYDSLGKKNGMWIQENGTHKYISYYKNGVEDGVFYSFNRCNLSGIGEIQKGKLTGTYYFFDDDGYILGKMRDFHYELTLIPKIKKYAIKYAPANCYCENFYKNGYKKSEGRWFFFDDPELEGLAEYGLWKYYDEKGNLIKTVEYK